VERLTRSSRAIEATLLPGRVSRSRAWRTCSGVSAGGRPSRCPRGAGGVEALVGAFDDELADELGEGGEDVEDEPSAGGGGVQGLVQ
jgi:hypothetical protein